MLRQKHIIITNPYKEEEFFNASSDILSLEIDGEFEGTLFLEGRNNHNHKWNAIGAFNVSNYNLVLNGFSQPGLYEAGVSSVKTLRIRPEENFQGTVSIVIDLISSSEV